MKNIYLTSKILLILLLTIPSSFFAQRYWVSAGPATWSSNNWSNSSGGAPDGLGAPTAGESAIFNANGLGNCTLDVNASFDGINTNGYTGTIDINGLTFNPSIGGAAAVAFRNGTITDAFGTSSITFITTATSIFSGTNFNTPINATVGAINFSGGTFNSPVTVVKNGTTNINGTGGCTFNSTLNVTNNDSGYFLMGYSNPDIFNGDVTLINNSTSRIRMAYNSAGNQFNGDLIVGSSNGSGVWICETGSANATFGAGNTISIAGSGFTAGDLRLAHLTQLAADPINITTTGTSSIYLGSNSVFNGNVTITSPNIYARGATYNNPVSFTKSGGTNNHNNGTQNIFNSTLEINQQSTFYFMLGYNSNEIFNDDITVNSTNTGIIYLGYSSGSGTATLAAGKTILVGGTGYNQGLLYLGSFTQLGNAPMNLSLSNLSSLDFFQSTIGGNLVSTSESVGFVNSTFNGTVTSTSTGSGNNGGGGNTFNQDVIFDNAGVSAWYTGQTTKDDFLGNLTITNNGTNITNIAHNSLNNTISGNLTVTNAGSGPLGTRSVSICNGSTTSSLAITGNLTVSNTGSANNLYTYIAENGELTIDGNLSITNSGTGNLSDIRVSNGTNSNTTIAGSTSVTNNNTAVTTSRVWLGTYGDIDFNGTLDIVNNAGNTNSEVFLNYGTASTNNYNDNITIGTYNTSCDGIFFGITSGNPGTGTLAAGKTIIIPGVDITNYLGGRLSFRGFTQLGATAHSFELPATASYIFNDQSNWGGDVNFIAPRIYNRLTTYNGTSYFEKTGALDDNFGGDNNYVGNAEFINRNTVANGSLQLAYSSPSQFGGNVTLRNLGSYGTLDLGNAIGIYNIAGNLIIENNGTGTGSQNMYVCEGVTSDFTIGGDVTINNSSNAIGLHSVGLAMNGTMVINGNTTASNINSNGTSKYIYLGNNGDITFNGTLDMISNSDATNNHFYLNHSAAGNNLYNENITVQSLNIDSDGFWFGNNQGSGTLAATKTISIPGVDITNFIGGRLLFRNFTQVGPTNHAFELAATANYIYNYDSNWGGDINFIAPSIYNRTSIFNGTSYFEKTGATNNDCYGGCTHAGNAEYVQNNTVAGGRFYIANVQTNSYGGNLTIRNAGSFDHIIYGSAAGTTDITGDLIVENTSTGTGSQYAYFLNNIGAIANVGGTATITNNANTTGGAHRIYFANQGQTNITGNTTVVNSSTGTDSYLYLGNVGSINFGGDLAITNSSPATTSAQIRVAESASSAVTIDGNTTLNSSTIATSGYCYLGYNGSVTFNGTLDMTNNSSGTNNHIHLNHNNTSTNQYNNDILVKSTNLLSDGFWFGNGDGAGTLAATRSITIPGVDVTNFIGGRLYFRNFTQTGPTDHSFELASTAEYIYNYNSNWGGNIDFKAPRIYNRTSTFNGTSIFEKSGALNDDSYGGCTHGGNAEYILSNSVAAGRMYLAGSLPNSYGGNLTLRNIGSFDNLLYGNSAGTTNVVGDLLLENITTGTGNQYVYLSNNAGAIINIGGNATVTNNANTTSGAHRIYLSNSGQVNITGNTTMVNSSNGTDSYIYAGNAGSIDFGGDLDLTNSSTATTNAQIRIAEGTGSSVTIAGNTTLTSSTVATGGYCYFGYNGDVTFNGTLDMTNNSSGTNNQIYLNDRTTSENFYNGDVFVKSTNALSDGFWFGNSGGAGTLATTKLLSIPGVDVTNFIGGRLHFRNFTQVGPTNHTFELAATADYIYNYDSDWGGDINFIAPRIYNRTTVYNGSAYFEKTGAGNDGSYGGCAHTGDAEYVLNNNVANGNFYVGNNVNNTYASDLTLSNIGDFDQLRYVGGTGFTNIDGDLFMTNSSTGAGNQYLYFLVNNAASANIAGNVTVLNNATGVSGSHNTYFGNNGAITVDGNTDVTNSLGGSTKLVYIGNAATIDFGGNVNLNNSATATNAQIRMAEGSASVVTIAGTTTVSNSSTGTTGTVYLGYAGNITFNGLLDMANSSSAGNSLIYLNDRNTSTNLYNDDITLTATHLDNDGYYFGGSGGTGTLAATKSISIPGVDATNFIGGQLYFRNFNQIGATAQSFDLSATTYRINNYQSNWGGDVDFRAPRMYTYGSTYDGTAYFEKNGPGNDNSTGGNTFNGNTTFKVTNSGYFMPANGTVNDFNANVTYIKTSTGPMYPSYNCANTYAGDITIESNTAMYVGAAGNGRAIMDGTIAQNINAVGVTPATNFRDLQIIKTAGDVTINAPINITVDLDLDQGIVNTSLLGAVSTLTVNDNAYVSSVSDASHVDGPVDKVGNEAFNFPVGDNGFYLPIAISNPASTSSRFRGQYFDIDPHNAGYLGYLKDPTLGYISDCEYWTLDRVNGTNNVNVTLSFKPHGTNGCSGVSDPSTLQVARWNGSSWKDHGNGGFTGTTAGTVTTSSVVTSFSPFTMASLDVVANPLPIELISFDANLSENDDVTLTWQTASEINNDYFTVERSSNGIDFEYVQEIKGAGNSTSVLSYSTTDSEPYSGQSYYRLKQTDFDGTSTYSAVKVIQLINDNQINIYPNPISLNNTVLNIVSNDSNIDEITILDNLGRIVAHHTTSNNKVEINVSSFEAGIYFIKSRIGNNIKTQRIVIQ